MNLKLQMKPLEEIDIFIFDTLTGILFDKVPEYKEIVEMGEDSFFSDRLTYLFMNEFATYLGGQIIADRTSSFVESSFDYINYIGKVTTVKSSISCMLVSSKYYTRRRELIENGSR
ncbi:hypothetical protein [Sphingobacterium ginsenosidimutans]|uniref:Uncharacterized protein n=1 Tax=Sphingobacterium ginsenosidimutans TaxID=687845 RepID=A0ABP8A5D6_9SPHI